MNNFDYIKVREKGLKEFQKINHDKNLTTLMKLKMEDILNFSKRSREDIKVYQLKQISSIVDYAYKNIHLYKKKYDEIGYKIGSIKSFEDFEKLPILYKEELIENFPHNIVKNISDFKFSTRSSGSSGRFVTIAVNLDAIYIDTLQGIRQFINQSGGTYKKEDVVLFIYTCPWWIEQINSEYKQEFLPTTSSVNTVIEKIKEIRPKFISTYPTYLQSICEKNINLGALGVELVIVHSEQSTSQMRDSMAKKLNVRVLDEYSSEELTRIALECPNKKYHIEEDASYIEIVDLDTHKVIQTGTGAVVGTNLLNSAMPIIRYWQGDIVTVVNDEKCTCGNNGRIIKNICGRQMDCILSNGKTIPASAFMDLAYNWFLTNNVPIHGIKYQIVQENKNSIKIF